MPATLLGEWGFLNNLLDTSGNARHGVFTDSGGAGFTYADGPHPGTRAVRFGGPSQYVTLGLAGLNPTTLGVTHMGWVRGGGAFNQGVIARARAVNSTRYGCLVYAGLAAPRARWRDDLHYTDTGPAVNDGTWHHLAVVDGNTRWAFLVDGVQIDGGVRAYSGLWAPETEFPWVSGYAPPGGVSNSAAGVEVSGLRIFHGELSDAEVVAWMNTPVVAAPSWPWADLRVGAGRAARVMVGGTQVWPRFRDEIAADSPLLWWPLDWTIGGTVVDVSGNGRDGTVVSAPTVTSLVVGGAMQFDATDDSITTAAVPAALNALTGEWTIEMWWRPPAAGFSGESALFGPVFSGTVNACMRVDAGRVHAAYYNGSWRTSGAGYLFTGAVAPLHLVATKDTSHVLRLYVDGVLYESAGGGGAVAAPSPAQVWRLNRRWDGTDFHVGGTYDEVVVFGTCLSAERVAAHYTGAPLVPSAARVARAGSEVVAAYPSAVRVARAGVEAVAVYPSAARVARAGVEVVRGA